MKFCVVAAAALALGVPVFAVDRPFYFTNVVNVSSTDISFTAPLINNNGQIAYFATKYLVGSAIVRGPDFENDAFVRDYDNGPFRSFNTSFVMNDAGDIAFNGIVRATNENGVFVNLDTGTNLASGHVGGVGPVGINNSGQVLMSESLGLYTHNPSRTHYRVLLGRKGSTTSTIVAENTFFGPDERFRTLESSQAVINNSGQIAHIAQAWADPEGIGHVEGIYRGNDRSSAIVETTGPLFDTDTWIDMNDSGQIAFLGSTDADLYNNAVMRLSPDGQVQTIASESTEIPDVNWVDINNAGDVAFGAYGNGGNSIFIGPDPIADRVVGTGDQIFGKTIRDAYMRRGGFNDKGQIAFHFITQDLTRGIAIATPALLGDADVSGTVNIADFARLAGHFAQAGDWGAGDFNLDGTVNINDFALLAGSFNQTFTGPQSAARGAAVPEPVSAGLIGLMTLGLRRRRA